MLSYLIYNLLFKLLVFQRQIDKFESLMLCCGQSILVMGEGRDVALGWFTGGLVETTSPCTM